jgi:SAM-dependent methyltransferase
MEVIDKKGIIAKISTMDKVVIELGCGNNPRIKNAITIDMIDMEGVDIVANLDAGLQFLPDNSVDEIYSFHFLEHLPDFGLFMHEIHRVLKPGGKKIGSVPHFSNPYYYSDYTHKAMFGLYSFSYFSKQKYFTRGVPSFYQNLSFKINEVRLVFWSPFKVLNAFRKVSGLIFNMSRGMQEWYEASWTGRIPVHEIRFEIEKT